jgi:opine dehydrogenase
MRIALVGGGSSAHVLAALLGGADHEVSILTRRPRDWAPEVTLEYQSSGGQMVENFRGKLKLASDQPAAIIPNAEVVILCMPVAKYRAALHEIAPWIPRDRPIHLGTIYGQGGFNWMVKEIIREYKLERISYFAVGLIPWICRTRTYGRTGITYGPKNYNIAAAYPAHEFDFLNQSILDDVCYRWFGKGRFHAADNFLSLTLSVDNQIIHPTRLYGLHLRYQGRWARKEQVPLFYRDYDQLSADLLKELDEDYSRVREAIKTRFPQLSFLYMLDYLALERLSYGSSNTNILESFVKSETLGAISTPVVPDKENNFVIDSNHRFFTDDIYYGLCVTKWIAQDMGIGVASLDRILNWAQGVLQDKIIDGDRLLMDPQPANRFKYGVPSSYGFNQIEQIVD